MDLSNAKIGPVRVGLQASTATSNHQELRHRVAVPPLGEKAGAASPASNQVATISNFSPHSVRLPYLSARARELGQQRLDHRQGGNAFRVERPPPERLATCSNPNGGGGRVQH
jgi:hypothetical protein